MEVRLEAIEAKLIRMRENKSAVTETAARPMTCTKESGYRCSIGRSLLMFCVLALFSGARSSARFDSLCGEVPEMMSTVPVI